MKQKILSIIVLTIFISGVSAQQKSNNQKNILQFYKPQSEKKVSVKTETSSNQNFKKAVIWSEDFINGMNSTNGMWTQSGANQIWKKSLTTTNGEWSVGTPAFVSTTSANGFMLFDADSVNFIVSPNYTDLSGDLISPTINLTGEPNVLLNFEQNYRYCCGGSAPFFISVSNNGGSSWTLVDTSNIAVNAASANPELKSIDVSAFIGGSANAKIKFAFGTPGNSHYYWIVDDISIESFIVTDVKENTLNTSFKIHPNPSKDIINFDIRGEVKSISIIDITGKTVKTITENSKKISIANLSNGTYIVEIETDNGISRSRFIKD